MVSHLHHVLLIEEFCDTACMGEVFLFDSSVDVVIINEMCHCLWVSLRDTLNSRPCLVLCEKVHTLLDENIMSAEFLQVEAFIPTLQCHDEYLWMPLHVEIDHPFVTILQAQG